MSSLPPNIESKFRLVHIAARRAEQLLQGARPKMESRHVKPTRVALDEVHANLVRWALPEEVEALEVPAEAAVLVDPLPTTND